MKRALRYMILMVGVIAALAIAVILWVSVGAKRDLNVARDTCRQEVVKHAKYESGVEFIDGTDDESETTSENGLISYIVSGEVDMVNGFGAPVRHTYWCHVGVRDGDVGVPEVTVKQK